MPQGEGNAQDGSSFDGLDNTVRSGKSCGFNALPPELLENIRDALDDIKSHVRFSRLCSKTRQLYNDRIFRDICLRAGFSRPVLYKDRSWSGIACAIVHHADQCTYCRDSLKWLPDMAEQMPDIYSEPKGVPIVKLTSELRQSVGTYTVNWLEPHLADRPGLSLLFYHITDEGIEQPAPQLVKHVTMACKLAFTVPLKKIRCGYEADDDWCFSGYSLAVYEDSELGAGPPSALEYRTQAVNEDGLTCLDLLVAVGNVPGLPISERHETPLVYNGLLDDQIRQGIVWVQGRV